MKTIYVKDFSTGQVIGGETFAISDFSVANDKNGNRYYNIELSDKTGSIKGKIWSNTLEAPGNIDAFAIEKGRVVEVDAVVQEYRGAKQLTINRLKGVDEVKMDDYMSVSKFSAEELMDQLREFIERIQSETIKGLLNNILKDEDSLRKLKYWPAGNSIHHAFRSGMLQHVLEMLTISDSLRKFYPQANYDIIYAGIVLHDIGKLEELDASGMASSYTKIGGLLGHVYIGTTFVDRYKPENMPLTEQIHLKHIILSHHGAIELGAPVVPATVEAQIVSDIDGLSSNAQKPTAMLEKDKDDEGMTAYNPWMGTRYWDGKSI